MDKKVVLGIGAVVVLIALAVVMAIRSTGSSAADTQSNVAAFAKQIDATNTSGPTVPKDRLMLGRSGKQPVRGP